MTTNKDFTRFLIGLRKPLKRTGPVLLVVAILLLAWASIFVIPNHLVHKDLVPDGTERTKQRHDVRATLLQSITAGLFLLGAYLTWQQVRIARDSQITDRFAKAVEQLGNQGADVRVGAIYALERIARNSETDRGAIRETLLAFITTRSPWPPENDTVHADRPISTNLLERRAPDVYAAFTVLARQDLGGRIDLTEVDLRYAYTSRGNLRRAFLWGVHFEGSGFIGASLDNVNLTFADLSNCDFSRASLKNAKLVFANVKGADFRTSNLDGADLTNASADASTQWPRDYNWQAAGAIKEDEEGDEDIDSEAEDEDSKPPLESP